jgi:hypothetical protein
MKARWILLIPALALLAAMSAFIPKVAAEDPEQVLLFDHYVRVKSTVPSMAGQTAQLDVRERSLPGTIARSAFALVHESNSHGQLLQF